MLDGDNTSPEWRRHPTDIVVLPVGAFEQHGPHLSLNTDIRIAEFLARKAAEHLDAALLPVLPIATSLEHSAFKGTFSLRPETLMQVVRDLAAEAERQGFRVMVIINGHGGNFSLGPVTRDLNRRNGPLKILLLHPFELADFSQMETRRQGLMDLHAGEAETSLLMHIAPRDYPPASGQCSGMRREELNTFGMGHINPDGIAGYPQYATREKGAHLAETMVQSMCASLDRHLAYLREHPQF